MTLRAVPRPNAIHDVDDPLAFVAFHVAKSGVVLTDHDREELIGEGLLILAELANQYQPRMEGYDQDGRFSGYAARYLPRRLSDAWHRLHPEHQYVRTPEGREWRYLPPPISLDGLGGNRGEDDGSARRGNSHTLQAIGLDRELHTARQFGQFVPMPTPTVALAA